MTSPHVTPARRSLSKSSPASKSATPARKTPAAAAATKKKRVVAKTNSKEAAKKAKAKAAKSAAKKAARNAAAVLRVAQWRAVKMNYLIACTAKAVDASKTDSEMVDVYESSKPHMSTRAKVGMEEALWDDSVNNKAQIWAFVPNVARTSGKWRRIAVTGVLDDGGYVFATPLGPVPTFAFRSPKGRGIRVRTAVVSVHLLRFAAKA